VPTDDRAQPHTEARPVTQTIIDRARQLVAVWRPEQKQAMDITNRTVFIAGATSGIGLELAAGLGSGEVDRPENVRAHRRPPYAACRARSTPQAVKPEREITIGMPICTVLITISEVSRPVV